MSEIQEMNLESESFVEDRLAKLREIMPEVFSEGGIDFEKLRLELGDEVDEGRERYAFTWPGKADAIRQSQTPSTATLRPCVEKSRGRDGEDGSFDSDNIYIEGDNLEVLKLLQRGYHGKVKMIYIDPPYNTGKDFVYHDSFGNTIENYREQAGLAGQSNADTSGRFHSDWCSMMYPRLRLARELLSDDGVIFISIDDGEQANLKSLCDEIFGQLNFVAQFFVASNSSKNSAKFVSIAHEYVICYARDIDNLPPGWEVKKNNYDEYCKRAMQLIKSGLTYDEIHRELLTLVKYPRFYDFDHFTLADENGIYETDNMAAPDKPETRSHRPLLHPITGKACPVPEKGWRFTDSTMDELLDVGKIEFGADETTIPRIKRYLHDFSTQTPKSLLFFDSQGTTKWMSANGFGFDYPKAIEFISYLISMYPDKDAIVLDFFSGSATTAHAAMKINFEDGCNRTYIMVQLPEKTTDSSVAAKNGFANLCDIGEERIRRAGNKIKSEFEESNKQLKIGEDPKTLPDIGFRVFTLDESGIERPKPGELMLDVVKPDRTDEDIVFEMMLKWGLELTLPVEKEEVAGYPVYTVAYGELVCCLAPGLSMEALEAIAEMEPRRVLMRDSILTDTLKLNAVQAFKRVEERTGRGVELRTV